MIALAFLAGAWFGALIGLGSCALVVAVRRGESDLSVTLAEIRALPEVHRG